jgi:hypothetical protein
LKSAGFSAFFTRFFPIRIGEYRNQRRIRCFRNCQSGVKPLFNRETSSSVNVSEVHIVNSPLAIEVCRAAVSTSTEEAGECFAMTYFTLSIKLYHKKFLARFTDGEETNNSMLTKNKKSRWQHDVKVLPLYDV